MADYNSIIATMSNGMEKGKSVHWNQTGFKISISHNMVGAGTM
jgi:hypothetical protein